MKRENPVWHIRRNRRNTKTQGANHNRGPNRRVGDIEDDVVERSGENVTNDNGKKLETCREHECVVRNIIFQQKTFININLEPKREIWNPSKIS